MLNEIEINEIINQLRNTIYINGQDRISISLIELEEFLKNM
jgi:ATP phosphoribosyltransferase regulatory subunit HisZ